jgi:hypothetical protein
MKYLYIKSIFPIALIGLMLVKQAFAAGGYVQDATTGCKIWDSEIDVSQTIRYAGVCKNGFADGQGTVEFIENGKVELIWYGFFTNGYLQGPASIKRRDSETVGIIRNSELNGEGRITFTNGTIVEGAFMDGKLNGYGKIRYGNGTLLKGWFKNNELNGYGLATYKNGITYEGNFIDGKLNGYGIQTVTNGGRYEGFFKNSKYDGIGTLFKPNGEAMPIAMYSDGVFIRIIGSSSSASNSYLSQQLTPSARLSAEQENELSTRISNTQNHLERSRSINIISPNGNVTTGTIWSNKSPGSIGLGGGTFIQTDK